MLNHICVYTSGCSWTSVHICHTVNFKLKSTVSHSSLWLLHVLQTTPSLLSLDTSMHPVCVAVNAKPSVGSWSHQPWVRISLSTTWGWDETLNVEDVVFLICELDDLCISEMFWQLCSFRFIIYLFLGTVNVSVTAMALASQTACNGNKVSVPERGRVDTVTKALVVKVGAIKTRWQVNQ